MHGSGWGWTGHNISSGGPTNNMTAIITGGANVYYIILAIKQKGRTYTITVYYYYFYLLLLSGSSSHT